MKISRQAVKKFLLRFWDFFCTKIPFISLAGIGLCWLVYYLAASLNHAGIDDSDPPYWAAMGLLVWATIIFGVLFVLGFIGYLIRRPLPARKKPLCIALRILAAAAVIPAGIYGVFLSIFIFAGAGY